MEQWNQIKEYSHIGPHGFIFWEVFQRNPSIKGWQVVSHTGTERAEYIQIIITSTQKLDTVITT